ncbi:MAG: nucleotidyltransferase domain-containing protein [Anaerolineales bacterium]|nr:nucleotidyltransferase domain-containing protein [Anaerolineales bacterium]
MMTVTEQKREQFLAFVQQVLAGDTAVKGVIAIGSMATGHMRPDSDIDAIIFLDPFDYFVVPAEAIWDAQTDTFHSIFTDDPQLQQQGLQLDIARLDWQQWSNPNFVWPEGRCAELSTGWIAYDPDGTVAQLIAARTAYPDELRLQRLDESITWLDQHLSDDTPEIHWQNLGPIIAHDRLQAAYDYLVAALFAYNRHWRIWRNREMQYLLKLPWLPDQFAERVLVAANAPHLDHEGYKQRVEMLRSLFADLLQQLIANGDYSHAAIDQAFIRMHDEPGRAWNMDEWRKFRLVRQMTITGIDEASLQ